MDTPTDKTLRSKRKLKESKKRLIESKHNYMYRFTSKYTKKRKTTKVQKYT